MKTLPITALFILISSAICFAADLPKLEKLKLKTGREYEKVTITEKRPDGISIRHDSGTARIKFEDLPEDLAKRLGGFDPAAAVKARQEADAKEAAALAEIDRGMAEQGQQQQAAGDRKATVAASRPAVIKVIQATSGGALCRIAWFEDQKMGYTGKDSFGRDTTTYKTTPGLTRFSEDFHFVTGVSTVDGAELGVALVSAGTYQYTTVAGAGSTIRKWRCISKPADASGASPESRPSSRPVRPPVSWRQSVGGG